ncbi:MAG: hypothetical protein AB7P04_13230 [Bacteriovoracia bacterium]
MFTFLLLFLSQALAGDRVFYFTGGPVDYQSERFRNAADEVAKQVRAFGAAPRFTIMHNSEWEEACLEIKEEYLEGTLGTLVLTGHSWGAVAALEIAECLEADPATATIRIPLMITLDIVPKFFRERLPEVIPENVELNYTYYQNVDSWLVGLTDVHRADGSHRGITVGKRVPSQGSGMPHNRMALDFFTDGSYVKLLSQVFAK